MAKNAARYLAGLVCRSVLPKAAYPVLFGPLRGARFVLGSMAGEAGGASVYVNRIEREQTEALVSLLKEGDVFFDVGANVGYYTILGSRLAGESGTIVAIEPVVRNLAFLHRHVRLNRADNVVILPVACSDEMAVVSFAPGANPAMGHLANAEESPQRRRTLAATVTLDRLAQELGLMPQVVKIDVEGAELRVLKGARTILLNARPRILLSVHSESLRSACLKQLGDLGYQSEVLSRDRRNPTEFLVRWAGG